MDTVIRSHSACSSGGGDLPGEHQGTSEPGNSSGGLLSVVDERDDLDEFQVFVHEVPEFVGKDVQVHTASTRHQDCGQERVLDDAKDGPIELPLEALDLFRGLEGIPVEGALHVALGSCANVD